MRVRWGFPGCAGVQTSPMSAEDVTGFVVAKESPSLIDSTYTAPVHVGQTSAEVGSADAVRGHGGSRVDTISAATSGSRDGLIWPSEAFVELVR